MKPQILKIDVQRIINLFSYVLLTALLMGGTQGVNAQKKPSAKTPPPKTEAPKTEDKTPRFFGQATVKIKEVDNNGQGFGNAQGSNSQTKPPLTKPSTSKDERPSAPSTAPGGTPQTPAPNRDEAKVAVDLSAVSGQTDPVFRSVEAKWKVTVPTGIIVAGFDAFIEVGLTNGQTASNTSNGLSATTNKSGFIADLRLFSGAPPAPAFDCSKCPPPAQRTKGDSCDRFCGGTTNNGVKVRSAQTTTTNAATLPDINRVKVTITARFKDTVRGGTFTKTVTREEAVALASKQ